MPTAVSFERNERVYVQGESAFGIIPNAAGVATLAAANAMRHIDVSLTPDETMIVREDKTGDRTETAGEVGRYMGNFSLKQTHATNGTPGTACDANPVLESLFCAANTVRTGTTSVSACTTGAAYSVTTVAPHTWLSGQVVWVPKTAAGAPWGAFVITVTGASAFILIGANSAVSITAATAIARANVEYTLGNLAAKSFDLWRFRTPATIRQEVGIGCLTASAKWDAGGDEGQKVDFSGPCKWITDNLSLANGVTDSDQNAGLTTFPVEPTSPVTNGTLMASFLGYAVINGVAQAKLRSWSISHNSGLALPQEYIGTRYGNEPEAGMRSTLVDFVIDDDDLAGSQLIYQAAQAATRIDCVFVTGNQTQGNTAVFYVRGVQLKMPKTTAGGQKFTRSYSQCKAHGSGVATLDELKLVHC
ncbi:MAG TPA: hypothetical protein VNH18_17570 [Bryobacteraceae bacterium]|nr:hypothetical protein [Bryobacteraceae bacterium]